MNQKTAAALLGGFFAWKSGIVGGSSLTDNGNKGFRGYPGKARERAKKKRRARLHVLNVSRAIEIKLRRKRFGARKLYVLNKKEAGQ